MKLNPTTGCGCCEKPPGCIEVECCPGVKLPRTVTVTDSNGPHTIGYDPTSGEIVWSSRVSRPGPYMERNVLDLLPHCLSIDQDILYGYSLYCGGGEANVWNLQLFWAVVNCDGTIFLSSLEARGAFPVAVDEWSTSASCDPVEILFEFTEPWPFGYPSPITPGVVRVTVETSDASDDLCCEPCPLPKKDLDLSWTNPTTGNGSAPLVWDAEAEEWTACVDGAFKMRLYCAGGFTRLDVTTYDGEDCTGTAGATCEALDWLELGEYTCYPTMQVYNVVYGGCPAIDAAGYETFTITEAAPPLEEIGPVYGTFGYNEQLLGGPAF